MKDGQSRFSSRTGGPSGPNPVSLLLQEKRRQNAKILDLTESNPTKCGFRFYEGKLTPFSDAKNLSYDPDPRGLLEARQAVCRYYAEKGAPLSPEQVFLTSGTSEAYGFLFRLLADAGDEVLAAEPGYPLFDTLAELHDLKLKKFRSVYREAWHWDADSLETAFGARTKALLLVHPNNPTGHFISAEERRSVNAACLRHDSALIVDEVFLDYAWGLSTPPDSFAGQNEVLTFTLSGISKILGLPQMKLSWIVVSGPEKLRAEAMHRLELIADAHLSVNTPAQRALPAWMGNRAAIVNEINGRVRGNFEYLTEKTRALPGARLLGTEGGWYALLQGPVSLSDESFALELLQHKDVLVYPGYFFDLPEDNFLVLSLLPPPELFQEGARRLCEGLL